MGISNGLDKKIEKIINDLYMIDESLKKHEKEVVHIVEELLRVRPDAELNKEFIEKLYLELMRRMEHIKTEQELSRKMVGSNGVFGKLGYSFAGVALMLAIIAVGTFYYSNKGPGPSGGIAIDLKPKIETLPDSAFGSLVYGASKAAPSIGGGGGGLAIANQESKLAMPVQDIINYSFVYKGGDIPIEDKAKVYKRVKDLPFSDKLAQVFGSLNLGLIDLGRLTNPRMANLTILEDREFGYDVNIDFREGVISLYAGSNWQDPYFGCIDQDCYNSKRLKEADMLKDEEAITLADKFLSDYQIDNSAYGPPSVMKDPGLYGSLAAQDSPIYFPEIVSVVYPFNIDGQTVYDDAASATGMIVEINIRQKKVFSARNIYMQNYESSNYAAEQDKAKIISLVEKGGLYGNYQSPEARRTVDVELGTPEIQLIATWNYDPEKRVSESLFVPSYVFPVTKVENGEYYYRKNIVVPAPKEMINKIIQDSQATPALLRK